MTLPIPTSVDEYKNDVWPWLEDLKSRTKMGSEWVEAMRFYSANDLYFLIRYVLIIGSTAVHTEFNVPYWEHQIFVDMARQFERHLTYPESLSCASRRLGKSEMRSCAIPIQAMIRHPDIAILIQSVRKELANKHLERIRGEITRNKLLLHLFPDIFAIEPMEEAKNKGTLWSKSEGFVIKGRKMNRSVATVETSALIGSPSIGVGVDMLIADDINDSFWCETPEKMAKLDAAFSESLTLLTPTVISQPTVVISNTRFAEGDLICRIYDRLKAENPDAVHDVQAEVVEEGGCVKYVYNDDVGPLGGRINYPFTAKDLANRFKRAPKKSEYVLQMTGSFKNTTERTLREEKIIWYDEPPAELAKDCTVYVCVDPSRGSVDPTAIWVWGLTHDKRKIWLDAIIRKMDPSRPEFFETLWRCVLQWSGLSQRVVQIRVEDVGPSTWSELIRSKLQEKGCYVPVVKVKVTSDKKRSPMFGSGKADRLYDRWSPMLNHGEVLWPRPVNKGGKGILCDIGGDGEFRDLVEYVLNVEWRPFPLGKHDDALDAGSLIADTKTNEENALQYGAPRDESPEMDEYGEPRGKGTSWMSA